MKILEIHRMRSFAPFQPAHLELISALHPCGLHDPVLFVPLCCVSSVFGSACFLLISAVRYWNFYPSVDDHWNHLIVFALVCALHDSCSSLYLAASEVH